MTIRREFAIYVSSTVEDLEEERKIAAEVVGQIGTRRHSYRASENGVVATCVKDVRACDLYIAILGQRYGWVPDGEDDPNAKSITEMEYDACDNPGGGRQRIPRLIFIKPTDHNPGIPQKHIDAFSKPKTRQRMENFLARANGPNEIAYIFKSAEQLRSELTVRVNEKAAEFHSNGANAQGILGGARYWRTRLAPISIACTTGSDNAIQISLRTYGGDRLSVFDLSPESASYIADADRRPALATREPDRGFATGQVACLIVTPTSLPRLIAVAPRVEAMIDVQVAASGRFVLACAGIDPAQLPAAWNRATSIQIDAAVVNGLPQAFVKELDDKISAVAPEVSTGTRLTVPYLVLAPTRQQVQRMCDPKGGAFDGFVDADTRKAWRTQFGKIAKKARALAPAWPDGVHGDQAEEWRCFGPAPELTVDELVRGAIDSVNAATFASRERRLLQDARLVGRRYRLADYLNDRFGSRQMIDSLRLNGCLILVDELALLDPTLRAAAENLLSGNRGAVVSIMPFDPAHSPTQTLLGDFSYLRVGNLISRFRAEHDPRCEVALNSIERVKRWLRFTIPELAVSNDDQEVQPQLAAQAHLLLPGVKP